MQAELQPVGDTKDSPAESTLAEDVMQGFAEGNGEWNNINEGGKEESMNKHLRKNGIASKSQKVMSNKSKDFVKNLSKRQKKHSRISKTFGMQDVFPAKRTKAIIDKFGYRDRSFFERLHLTIDDPASGVASTYFLGFVILVIVTSCVTYVMETMPMSHVYDGVNSVFLQIENVAVVIFSVEYLLRFLTAWTVPTDSEIKELKDMDINTIEVSDERALWNPTLALRIKRLLQFVIRPMNVVDVVAILPTYINYATGGKDSFTFIRLLRLFRILRLLKIRKMTGESAEFSDNLLIFVEVYHRSKVALTITMIYTAFITILWAAIIFVVEKGTWDHNTGRFMIRESYYLDAKSESFYTSIPDTVWWVLVTLFTVGYGDITPRTPLGKIFGVMVMYTGVMLLAMPITIIGGKFHEIYDENMQRRERLRQLFIENSRIIVNPLFESRNARLKMAWRQWRNLVKEESRTDFIVKSTIHGEIEHIHDDLESMQRGDLRRLQEQSDVMRKELSEIKTMLQSLTKQLAARDTTLS